MHTRLNRCAALFWFTAAVSPFASAETINGRVVGVADGDTVTVLDPANRQHKIRLAGIDAPEKAQPFGQRSKASLSNMVFGRQVIAECGKMDRYRREVCKIIVNGVDANLEQVKAGMAWWYRKYAKEQQAEDRAAYEKAEAEAQAGRRGLWSDPKPMPPWEWRHR
jgi:endonuclease YncB( thermonuclease family)